MTGFNSIDGSTYDPFTKTLLFTQEAGSAGGVIQITSKWPAVVTTLDGIIGKGGYEGITSTIGLIFLAEDAGGVSVNVDPNDPNSPKVAKQPNSFIYRFVPYDPKDLSQGGKLQALQVSIDGIRWYSTQTIRWATSFPSTRYCCTRRGHRILRLG